MPVSHLTLSDRGRALALVAHVVWADSRLTEPEVEALFAAAAVLGVDARIAGESRPTRLELPETSAGSSRRTRRPPARRMAPRG